MYIFVGPVTHYSCRLDLMGFFAIYPVNSLWPSSLGSSVCWASTNGPQHIAQESLKRKEEKDEEVMAEKGTQVVAEEELEEVDLGSSSQE